MLEAKARPSSDGDPEREASTCFGPAAHPAGELGQAAGDGGQQASRSCPAAAGAPASGPCRRWRRPPTMGLRSMMEGKIKLEALGVIHQAGRRGPRSVALWQTQGIHLEIVGGGHHQDPACQMGWSKPRRQMGEATGKFMEIGPSSGRDQGRLAPAASSRRAPCAGRPRPAHQAIPGGLPTLANIGK